MPILSAEECENLSSSDVTRLVVAWGDSLTAGAGATNGAATYPAVASGLFDPDRPVANRGQGGETSTQILTRLLSDTSLRHRTAWLWTGRNGADPGHTVAGDIAAAVEALGHSRYLIGSIMPWATDSEAAIAAQQALNASLLAAYAERFINVISILQAANDGSPGDLADIAAGYTPRSLRSDSGHLNDAGYGLAAAAFKAANDAMGW